MWKAKSNLIQVYNRGRLCIVSTFGSQIKEKHWHFSIFFFTVAVRLDDTHRQCAFVVLIVGMGVGGQGAAWQCLTLRGFRAGDQHHEAQLSAELRGTRGVSVL